MEKLDLQTPDFTAANIARLAELFPNCATETRLPDGTLKRAIDFDLLRQELSHDLVEGPQERYRLDWPGKREALALANAPIRKTLRPSREESVSFDSTRNLYIEGDNLDALKLLQETYLGQVKMIYIDPPYNTGNDFIYDDNFSMSREDYAVSSGEVDQEGNAMFDSEKWKLNSSTEGRFHSEWLSMMYSRLKLAKNLLHDEGFLFVSISDCELHSLIAILDQVFGSSNRVETFIWESIFRPSNMSKRVRGNAEYVLAYAKNANREFELVERYEDPQGDASLTQNNNKPRELRFPPGILRISLPAGTYSVSTTTEIAIKTDLVVSNGTNSKEWIVEGRFKWTQEYLDAEIAKGVLLKVKTETLIPYYRKVYQQTPLRPKKILPRDLVGDVLAANAEIGALLDRGGFDYPKPTSLVAFLIRTFGIEGEDLILDFFSGSATTAHAVMQLNAEDGGNRRHIMVQLPEPCDEKSEAFKAGYATIAEIGKERIRRAGKKILAEWQAKHGSSPENLKLETENSGATAPDIGFRVLKIDSSNFNDVYYQPDQLTQDDLSLQVDNLKRGRGPQDLLFQVLLDWGVDLALPVTEEHIAGRRVFFVDGDALAACFETGLDEAFVKALAARAPLRAVFRDAGYASDAVKINIEQIFKALSPHTELKTL